MIPKKGDRFSGKIMLNKNNLSGRDIKTPNPLARRRNLPERLSGQGLGEPL